MIRLPNLRMARAQARNYMALYDFVFNSCEEWVWLSIYHSLTSLFISRDRLTEHSVDYAVWQRHFLVGDVARLRARNPSRLWRLSLSFFSRLRRSAVLVILNFAHTLSFPPLKCPSNLLFSWRPPALALNFAFSAQRITKQHCAIQDCSHWLGIRPAARRSKPVENNQARPWSSSRLIESNEKVRNSIATQICWVQE